MNVLDLFSGIGGFSLGLERAGMRTVAFCEIEPFCRAVLRKHWPKVPIYEDVRELTADRLRADGISVDVIAGGFPCQDVSHAGKGAGIEGSRSGLWSEYGRLIGEIRPRYAIVENVPGLLSRGLDRVLGDLAEIGYDAEWHCIPASAVGAPHLRDRVWILAYPQHSDSHNSRSYREALYQFGNPEFRDEQIRIAGPLCKEMADTNRGRRGECEPQKRGLPVINAGGDVADAGGGRSSRQGQSLDAEHTEAAENREAAKPFNGGASDQWRIEPDVGRVAHGVPNRVDRLKGLGNAVVPQIPEIIGRAIMQTLND